MVEVDVRHQQRGDVGQRGAGAVQVAFECRQAARRTGIDERDAIRCLPAPVAMMRGSPWKSRSAKEMPDASVVVMMWSDLRSGAREDCVKMAPQSHP